DPGGVRYAGAGLPAEREVDRHAGDRGPLEILQASRHRGGIVIIAARRSVVGDGGRHAVRTGQAQRVVEEGSLGVGIDGPVDGRRLVAVAVVVDPGIQVTPGDTGRDRGVHVVEADGVLVDDDRLRV